MPSLTHVCMFSEHGWREITAQKAGEIYPDTVSAVSGIFMCNLCHQYVYFSNPQKKERYFGHTKEADKSCPERTFSFRTDIDSRSEKHDLPIRLKLLPSDFELELGLLGVPASDLQKLQDHKIQITPIGRNADPLSYALKERLSENEISYVLIGTIPYPEYQIQLDCRSIRAFSCWPERIRGIESPGALFDAVTRKKLPYDADVQLGKNYYLLQSGMLNGGCSSVRLKQIRSRSVPGNCWRLYEVSAIALDVDAAKFFLQFHCRLTDQAVSIQPIWPIYTKSPYVIHHNAREMIFYVKGDVHTKSYPYARQRDRKSVV